MHARSGVHKSLATFSQIGLVQLGYQSGEERVSGTSRFASHHLPLFFFVLVSLTKTAKKGLELKQNLIEEVRACSFYFSRPCIWFINVGVGLFVRETYCLGKKKKKVLIQPFLLQQQHQ